MKILLLTSSLLCAALCPTHAADSPAPEKGSLAETKNEVSWAFQPDPALPNVLILGDSISIGYTLHVRKLLAGKANVFRPVSKDVSAADTRPINCAGTTHGIQNIDGWLRSRSWDVIHFNWGLHDLKHVTTVGSSKNSNLPGDPLQATVEQYGKNLEVIVGKLKTTGARLVFATTTPVAPDTLNPLREPDAPGRYNAAALQIMRNHGIPVNDLFGFCEPQLEKLQMPRNVHFTASGSTALAGQVAAALQKQLGALRK